MGSHIVGMAVVVGLAAFGWFAPTSWLTAGQYVLPPLALLFTVFCATWAYRLRDEDDDPGGDNDVEVVLPPDPGGLSIDWDAELQALLSTPKGTK